MRLKHKDDEWFDEIHLKVVPRFKRSGLSGDEWRVSTVVRFYRKGQVQAERSFNTLRSALAFLPGLAIELAEALLPHDFDAFCDQPGCSELATVCYRLKARFCQPFGAEHPCPPNEYTRCFCSRHAQRGDAGLEDADDNYEILEHDSLDISQRR